MRPAALRPWAIRTLSPAASRTAGALYGRATVVSLPVIVAATPLTSALTTPGPTVPLTAMDSVATANPSAGAPIVIDGSPVTRWRTIVAGVPVGAPFASVQAMVTLFGPSFGNSTDAAKEPSATTAAIPLAFTPMAPPERPTRAAVWARTTEPFDGSKESSL